MKLPDLGEQARPTPTPSGGIASYQTEDAGAAMAPGLAVSSVANEAQVWVAKEIERVDSMIVESDTTKLRAFQQELTMGKDGFINQKGDAAIRKPLLETYTKRYTDYANELAGKMSPNQQAAFKKRTEIYGLELRGGIMKHLVSEGNETEKRTFETGADQEIKIGSAQWETGSAVAMAVANLDGKTKKFYQDQGFTEDDIKKEQSRLRGMLAEGVITGAIAGNNTEKVQEYMAYFRPDLNVKQREALNHKWEAKTDFEGGRAIGLEAYELKASGKSAVEVEKFLTEKTKTKGQYSVAQSVMTQMDQAAKAEDENKRGGILEGFAAKPNRATMNSILGSDEYQAMGQGARGQLAEYMRHQVQAAEDRYRGLADRAEAKARQRWDENPEALAIFSALADNPALGGLSTGQVMSYAPEIGPVLVARLEAKRKLLASGAEHFKMPPDDIQRVLPTNLKKATTEAEKAQVDAFTGIIKRSLIEWQTENKGRTPDKKEQDQILLSASREVQQIGFWSKFKTTNAVPAYKLKPMPPAFREQAIAAARAKGITLNESQIIDGWATQEASR